MKALLIIAHGSRRQASNDEVRELAENLKSSMGKEYPVILACFLELAEPLIPQGLDLCLKQGVSEIDAVPYFLSAGRHVQTDVPTEIADWQKNNPRIKVNQISYVGASKLMFTLIEQSVSDFHNNQSN